VQRKDKADLEVYVTNLLKADPHLVVYKIVFVKSNEVERKKLQEPKEEHNWEAKVDELFNQSEAELYDDEEGEKDEVKPWSRSTANDHQAGPSGRVVLDIFSGEDFDGYYGCHPSP
jgi:hypothetical protein